MLASRLRQRVFERGGSGSQIAYGVDADRKLSRFLM
jgi:hypothetical protein